MSYITDRFFLHDFKKRKEKENTCVEEKIVSVTAVLCSVVCSEHRRLSGLTSVRLVMITLFNAILSAESGLVK
jgi:hypothetical protein